MSVLCPRCHWPVKRSAINGALTERMPCCAAKLDRDELRELVKGVRADRKAGV